MTSSKRIAGLLGPTLIAMTISESEFISPHLYEHQIAPVVYLSGTLLFLAGLSIVRVHNRWTGGWPVLVTLMGWLAILGGLSAQPVSVAEGPRVVEPALESAMAERQKANLEGDTRKIEDLMAAEYVQTDIGGRVQTKSEWLSGYFKPLAEMIKAGQFRWEVWEETNTQTRSFGDTVVVVGKLRLKGRGASYVPGRGWVSSPEGSFGPVLLMFTRVWIKRDGRWLLAAVHNALPPQQGND
jgi:hypothetical protein